MRPRLLHRGLVPLLALAACGPPDNGTVVGKCKDNTECETGKFCNKKGFCQTALGCLSDTQCGANRTCDVGSGVCLCANDQACTADQFCNQAKRCQDRGACSYNGDCPTGKICDVATAKCIEATACTADTQCDLGKVCDTGTKTCTQACRDSGDCPQTSVNGSGVTVFDPQGCVGGFCVKGKCTSNLGCTFGQTCTNNTCGNGCSSTTPYCRTCDPSSLFPNCGGSKNYCLNDPRNAANCTRPSASCKFFCGTDCSAGQTCPAGYECYELVVVVPSLSCNCNTQCANGTGLCQCNEGATSGFCKCRTSSDCGILYTCSNGYCIAGKNCGPSKGLYCDAPGPACP